MKPINAALAVISVVFATTSATADPEAPGSRPAFQFRSITAGEPLTKEGLAKAA